MFVKISGKQHCLWPSVDQDANVVSVYIQAKRNGAAATRFFSRLLRSHGSEPRKIVTDNLRNFGVANRELMHDTVHSTHHTSRCAGVISSVPKPSENCNNVESFNKNMSTNSGGIAGMRRK